MYYRLSRFSRAHELLRRTAYAVLWRLPASLKYGSGALWRRFRLPYKLLRPGDAAIQIGAPWDTLRAGRSRAVHFARFVGNVGKVVVIEPAPDNLAALREFTSSHGMTNLDIVPSGAWSKKARLRFLSNPDHPASNLVEEVCDDRERDRNRYQVSEIDVDSVDRIAASRVPGAIRLLSITTNGSEIEILKGAEQTLGRTEYVSLITDQAEGMLKEHGFVRVGHDDRGYTYRRK